MELRIIELEKKFQSNKNEENAKKQKKYLKDQFEFLGLPKPSRAKLEDDFIKSFKNEDIAVIMECVKILHNKKYREYMYTAQTLLLKNIKKLQINDIYEIVNITRIKPWWENTDGYMAVIKRWLKIHPDYIEGFVLKYYQNENFWIRRLSIICQLSLKEDTNFEVLKTAIYYNIDDKEFFIQKAIGWALRDYSKSNADEVREFIKENEDRFSNLAIREGSKYL